MSWNPSDQYKKVAKANKQYYERNAILYDEKETCVVSPRLQVMVQRDLDNIMQMISRNPERQIHALDACGGSGNIALKLLARGVNVTLCDISPELLQIFESKCKERRFSSYTIVCQEIGFFLSRTDLSFDLIVFSSALHHIEDYTTILKMATNRLNDGGFIYTVFDPVKWHFPTYHIIWLDWFFYAVLNYPNELFSAVRKKLKKVLTPPENIIVSESDLDTLAEYHVRRGIDDLALIDVMEKTGLEVISHERYIDARLTPFRLFLSIFKRPTGFKMLLRKN